MTLTVTQEDEDQAVTTPTVAKVIARVVAWVAAGVVVVVVAILVISAASGGLDQGTPLAADNPGPQGAKAVVEVLKQQGVKVVLTSDLDDTLAAADDDSTIVLWDIDLLLDESQHSRLLNAADDLVVLDPTVFELQDLAPGVDHAGSSGGTFSADCSLDAVRQAGTVQADGSSYRIQDGADATGCLADGDRYGLVQLTDNSTTVTLLGLTSVLTNERISSEGDAALALNLLGKHPKLVWYIPSPDDLAGQAPPSIADLTPPWVTPFVVMLVLVALGAIFWRARRVGPLVVENLPVVVRSSETMQGRARLYERSGARLHALDALRIGAVSRLATMCGLSRLATVDEVVDAVASATGRDRAAVAGILIYRVPQSDAELVQLSDELLALEADTTTGTRP